jgi:hypothetical protein
VSVGQPRTLVARDSRMDFWRGLCLLDMLLVHLIYQSRVQFGPHLGPFFGEYARFAAGAFVFLAGMGVGRFFLPKANNPATRRGAYMRLWRRATILLCAHYIGTFCHILFDQWLGYTPVTGSPLTVVRDVLLLRQGDDLLPFYVLLTTITPLLLALLRRRDGFVWVAGISMLLFYVGSTHPYATPLFPNFPPLLWQMIFISGLLAGAGFKRYDKLSRRVKIGIMATGWVAFALLFYSDYASDFGWPRLNLGVIFYKRPLSLGETLRYLSMTIGLLTSVDLLWPIVSKIPGNSLIATMGRRSLVVYVSHLFLVSLVAWVCDYELWRIGMWQMLLIIPAAVLLWLVAASCEWISAAIAVPLGRRAPIAEPSGS